MSGFFYKYKIPTLMMLLWVIGIVTFATIRTFSETPPVISMGTASAFGALLGLPAIAVGLWRWRNEDK